VEEPVVVGKPSGADAVDELDWSAIGDVLAQLDRQRRVSAVEADGEGATGRIASVAQRLELLVGKGGRFLDEYRLARTQGGRREIPVRVVARRDRDDA